MSPVEGKHKQPSKVTKWLEKATKSLGITNNFLEEVRKTIKYLGIPFVLVILMFSDKLGLDELATLLIPNIWGVPAEVSTVPSVERQGKIEDVIQPNTTVSVTYPEEEEREIPSTTTATIPLVTYQEKEEGEISSTGSVVADDYAKQWGRNVLRKSDLTASGNDKVRFVWWGTLKRMQIKGSKDDKGIPYYESFATSLDDLNEKRPMGYIVPSTYVYALARKYEIGSSQEKWYLVHVSGYGFYRWIQADKNNLTSPEPTNFPVSFLN